MKAILKKLFGWLFKEESALLVGSTVPLVTEKEAYVPFYSETLNKFLLSQGINLKDPIDASVKIRTKIKQTPDAVVLKGNVRTSSHSITPKVKAATNQVFITLKDLVLNQDTLIIESSFPDTIVIINVSGRLNLSKNSKIHFRGGIPASNVLINYTGNGSPSLMTSSSLVGTLITPKRLSVLNGCVFEGETIGSEPLVSNGKVINKTIENMAKLQAEREKEFEKKKRNGGVDSVIK
jgi:hypothetical protein